MNETIARLKHERIAIFAEVDQLANLRTSADRLRNAVRQANASRLLAWRAAAARLRWNWPNGSCYVAGFGTADIVRLRSPHIAAARPHYLRHGARAELYGRVNSTAP